MVDNNTPHEKVQAMIEWVNALIDLTFIPDGYEKVFNEKTNELVYVFTLHDQTTEKCVTKLVEFIRHHPVTRFNQFLISISYNGYVGPDPLPDTMVVHIPNSAIMMVEDYRNYSMAKTAVEVGKLYRNPEGEVILYNLFVPRGDAADAYIAWVYPSSSYSPLDADFIELVTFRETYIPVLN